MLIHEMPQVLTWRDNRKTLQTVHDSYVSLLCNRLGKKILRIRSASPQLADAAIECQRMASDRALCTVLTAPETSYRILENETELLDDARFLIDSFTAERCRQGYADALHADIWTALGDRCFKQDGTEQAFPQSNFGLVLDFGSPLTAHVHFGGEGSAPDEYRAPFNDPETSLVVAKINAAGQGILEASKDLREFCTVFNKVLICQKDPAAPGAISSGSTGQYPGRSFVTNPQLDRAGEVELAEAIVHEGIHGLLYMQERLKPWIKGFPANSPRPAITSPWSGNRLSVRSFIQAGFVWYGLANFWFHVLARPSPFSLQEVRHRLNVAMAGFLAGDLVNLLEPFAEAIDPELMEVTAEMQSTLVAAVAA